MGNGHFYVSAAHSSVPLASNVCLPKGFLQCFQKASVSAFGRFPSVFPKGLLPVLRKDFCQSFQRHLLAQSFPKDSMFLHSYSPFWGFPPVLPKASVWHFRRKALVSPIRRFSISPSVSSSRKLPLVLGEGFCCVFSVRQCEILRPTIFVKISRGDFDKYKVWCFDHRQICGSHSSRLAGFVLTSSVNLHFAFLFPIQRWSFLKIHQVVLIFSEATLWIPNCKRYLFGLQNFISNQQEDEKTKKRYRATGQMAKIHQQH